MSDMPFEELEDATERPFNTGYFFRMLGYMRPYKKEMAITALGILLASGVSLFEPYLLGRVVDEGIIGGNLQAIQQIAVILLVLHLLAWVGAARGNGCRASLGKMCSMTCARSCLSISRA